MLSKKIGENPPVAELRPEEIPLIATMYDDDESVRCGPSSSNCTKSNRADTDDVDLVEMRKTDESDHNDNDNEDDEIAPKNYFFWYVQKL